MHFFNHSNSIIGSYDAAPARVKCLPKDKPTACSNVAWNDLLTVFEGTYE